MFRKLGDSINPKKYKDMEARNEYVNHSSQPGDDYLINPEGVRFY